MPGPAVTFKFVPKIAAASLGKGGGSAGIVNATRELKLSVEFTGVRTPRAAGDEEMESRSYTHADLAW